LPVSQFRESLDFECRAENLRKSDDELKRQKNLSVERELSMNGLVKNFQKSKKSLENEVFPETQPYL
jgi:hypothetical protein